MTKPHLSNAEGARAIGPAGVARLFAAVRAAEDAMPEALDLARARVKLARTLEQKRRPAAGLGLRFAAAFAATLVLGLTLRVVLRLQASAGDMVAGALAPPSAVLEGGPPSTFRDGSTIVLSSGSRAHVEDATPEGAVVRLDAGRLTAAIVHRAATRWMFRAGPYDVHVTGTRFELAWDPGRARGRLSMHEGSVRVSGPDVPDGKVLRGGEALDLSGPAPVADEATSLEVEGDVDMPSDEARPEADALGRRPRDRSSGRAVGASWRELARLGRYADAFAAAERADFDAECEHASAADLLLLGDVARLAGKDARAAEAYRALRRRFPRDARAGTAAFMLGRLAFERRGDYQEAASWFSTTLREQPDGALAREALGRLLEAKHRAGDVAGARDTARAYLAKYPTGPRASLARDLVGP